MTRRAGFTLIELLVALAVISTGVTVVIRLYNASLDMGQLSQERRAASRLAEEQLTVITQAPNQFLWISADGEPGERYSIMLGVDDPPAGNAFAEPNVLPATMRGADRDSAFYDKFRWKAFARQPLSASYVEVTVHIEWDHIGQAQLVTLTTALPESAVPETDTLEESERTSDDA